MVVLQDGSPISTEELWSSVRVIIVFLVTSLTKALLPRMPSVAGQPALGRGFVAPNFIQLKNYGGYCVLGVLQRCRNVLVPFPRSVPRHNPVSELYGEFLWPHGLEGPKSEEGPKNC